MNTADKLTMSRMVLAVLIIIILMIPWEELGLSIPTFYIMGKVLVDIRYLICGFIFVIASVTDFLDGSIARKENTLTDFGATLDAIADKILVNGLLIILAYQGFLPLLIPVIIVIRDIAVDALRTLSAKNNVIIKASKLGKVKTVCMLLGLSLMLFYNLPFEVWGIYAADILIYIATILSVVSGILYFMNCKDKIKLN